MNEAGDQVTVVVLNSKEQEQSLRIDLSAFGASFAGGAAVRTIRTSGSIAQGEHWYELPEEKTTSTIFTTALPAHAVATFIFSPEE